jgi:hypothetical protein
MRGVQLARIAAEAELLRLRSLAKRQGTRVALAVVAAIFVLAAMIAGHVAGAMALTAHVAPVWATLIVGGIDLAIALALILLATRNTPSKVEREALEVRRIAQEQMKEAAALTMLVGPLLRLIGTRKVYGLALAAFTARYLSGRR